MRRSFTHFFLFLFGVCAGEEAVHKHIYLSLSHAGNVKMFSTGLALDAHDGAIRECLKPTWSA